MRAIIMMSVFLGIFSAGTGTAVEPQDPYSTRRHDMVKRQIAGRGVTNERVLAAMDRVPRHLFVPEASRREAYEDYPVTIGQGQTISQPYIVAYMTEALELTPNSRVLEIGTGSGYQAAILAEIVKEVYTVEILPDLAERARHLLIDTLGYKNIRIRTGDGYKGWVEHAPYDAIIVTAAPPEIPKALIMQLAENGRIIIPVGGQGLSQELILGIKKDGKLKTTSLLDVRFVPLVPEK
jgi:protein-L-isoaspartate(D-aspartate) O-methyltransferase